MTDNNRQLFRASSQNNSSHRVEGRKVFATKAAASCILRQMPLDDRRSIRPRRRHPTCLRCRLRPSRRRSWQAAIVVLERQPACSAGRRKRRQLLAVGHLRHPGGCAVRPSARQIDVTFYSAGASAGCAASLARGGRIEVGLDTASNYILPTPTWRLRVEGAGGGQGLRLASPRCEVTTPRPCRPALVGPSGRGVSAALGDLDDGVRAIRN